MWLSSKKEGLSGSSYQVGLSRAIKTLGNKSFIRLFDIFMCEVMWSISECDNPGNPVTLPYIHNTYTNCHLYNNTRKQELFSFYFKHLNTSIKWSAWHELGVVVTGIDTWHVAAAWGGSQHLSCPGVSPETGSHVDTELWSPGCTIELQTKVHEVFTITARPASLKTFASATQFCVYLPWCDVCLA